MEKPFPAYEGDEPYIFVSYSHADDGTVYPEIQWLHDQGFNVWYDEGISPGTSWRRELAEKIDGASLFLFLVTPQSVISEHCEREVNYAVDQGKALVTVHLTPTDLPSGLNLTLGSIQAILRYELSDHDYRKKLIAATSDHIQRGVAFRPEQRSRASSLPTLWMAAGYVILGLAIGIVAMYWAPRSTEQHAEPAPLMRSTLTLDGFGSTQSIAPIAISPSGKTIAFIGQDESGQSALMLRHLERLQTVHLTKTEDARNPFFSPDGQWVGYFESGVMKRVPVGGGAASIITALESPQMWGATWGADDRIVFAEQLSGLRSVSVSGRDTEILTELDVARWERSHRTPNHVPGHDLLLFAVMVENVGDGQHDRFTQSGHEIWALRLSTGERRYLLDGISPRYVDSGYIVYSTPESGHVGSLWAAPFDAKDMVVTGAARPIQSAVAGVYGTGFAISDAGPLLYLPDPGQLVGELLIREVDGTSRTLDRGPLFSEPRFSHDGTMIAVGVTEPGRRGAIWVYDVETGASRKFSDAAAAPVWSLDDQSITFFRAGTGLMRQPLDGTDAPKTLLQDAFHAHAWINEGRTLTYQQLGTKGTPDVFAFESDGQTRVLIGGRSAGYPTITKDERWVAFCAWGGGGVHIGRFPNIGSVTIASDSGCFPQWGLLDTRLYFQDDDKLWAVDAQVSESVVLGRTEFVADLGSAFAKLYDVDKSGRLVTARWISKETKPPVLVANWARLLE